MPDDPLERACAAMWLAWDRMTEAMREERRERMRGALAAHGSEPAPAPEPPQEATISRWEFGFGESYMAEFYRALSRQRWAGHVLQIVWFERGIYSTGALIGPDEAVQAVIDHMAGIVERRRR